MLTDYGGMLGRIVDGEGDVVEIGCLVGDGTRQLAERFPGKTIWAVDCFNIYLDKTRNDRGVPMFEFYKRELDGSEQFRLFCDRVKGLHVLIQPTRSEMARYPEKIWLAVIDGSHEPEVVRGDFERVRHAGYVAFHDYGLDLPELTKVIDEMTKGLDVDATVPGWLIVRS